METLIGSKEALDDLSFNQALRIHKDLEEYARTGEVYPDSELSRVVSLICPYRYTYSFIVEMRAFEARFYKYFARIYFNSKVL